MLTASIDSVDSAGRKTVRKSLSCGNRTIDRVEKKEIFIGRCRVILSYYFGNLNAKKVIFVPWAESGSTPILNVSVSYPGLQHPTVSNLVRSHSIQIPARGQTAN